MPETIPTHFNFKGEADCYGSKSNLWILPGIAILIYSLFSILNRFPHIHNYMVNITEENAMKNYRFSSRMLRFVLLWVWVLVLFTLIQHKIITYDGSGNISMGNWLNSFIIGIIAILPIFIIVYQYKINKK